MPGTPRGAQRRTQVLIARIGLGLTGAGAAIAIGCSSSSGNPGTTANPGDASAPFDATAIPPAPGEDGGDGGCVHGPFPSPDIYDEHCNFDLASYQHLAGAFGADDGLRYRFGPDSTYYHPTPEAFPLLPRAQVRLCGSGPIPGPPQQELLYQLGTCETDDPGYYSSVEGLVLYNLDPQFPDAGEGNGVDNIAICDYDYETFFYDPSPSPDLGDPTVPYLDRDWLDAGVGPVRGPTSVARGIAPTYGQTSQCGFVAFADGVIGTIGTNTENCGLATKVPAGLVPTAVGLTNGSEFLLVTMWDPIHVKASLGVFTIDADFAGSTDFDGKIYAFHQHLPGFPSIGFPTSMKYLGAIDLPGMIAPTDLAVASNYRSSFFYGTGGGYENPANFDLTQQDQWATFTGTGSNSGNRSTAGFAVVASRSERKVIFVDLQPLFDAFNKEYFTDFATFMTTQTNWGTAPNQWPFTFDVQPQAKPVVVTTVTTAEIPTAVFAGRYGESDPTKAIHALVATMDGTLHIYQVGGLIDATAAQASDVKEIGSMSVGKNPVYLGKKDSPLDVIVAARGDRSVNFVTLTGATGTITRQLQDDALLDPVYVDEADDEGFGQNVISVADLKGEQILNYRTATVTLPNDGGVYPLPAGEDGGPTFECGGAYSVRGEPFAVSGTNVP